METRKKYKQLKMRQKEYLELLLEQQEQEKYLLHSYNQLRYSTSPQLSRQDTPLQYKEDVNRLKVKQKDLLDIIETGYDNFSSKHTTPKKSTTSKLDPNSHTSRQHTLGLYSSRKQYLEDLVNNTRRIRKPPNVNGHTPKTPKSILKKPNDSTNNTQKPRSVYASDDLIFEDDSIEYLSPRDIGLYPSEFDSLIENENYECLKTLGDRKSIKNVNFLTSHTQHPIYIEPESHQDFYNTHVYSSLHLRPPLLHEKVTDVGTFLSSKLADLKIRKQTKEISKAQTKKASLVDVRKVPSPLDERKNKNKSFRSSLKGDVYRKKFYVSTNSEKLDEIYSNEKNKNYDDLGLLY